MVTRKQHYYPRGLLKHFANENKKVFVYTRKSKGKDIGKKIIRMNYEKICASNYAYESEDQIDNILENKLGTYESKVIPIIDYIIENFDSPDFLVTKEDEQILFQYIWLQYLRTDMGRINFINFFENIFSYKPRKKPLGLEEIENNKEKINRFNKVFKQDNNLERLLNSFINTDTMNFHIALSTENLLTSDNPVIGTDNWAQIILPISPRICIEFQHDIINSSKNLLVLLAPDKIRYLNKATINTANYFVISNEYFTNEQIQ